MMRAFSCKIVVPAIVLAAIVVSAGAEIRAQTGSTIPAAIRTPDQVDTRIGTLEFKDGVPTSGTAQKVSDTLDFTRALEAYNNSFRGASAYALGKGFQSVGAEDNSIVIFSELMDAKSLFLTANCDTVYYVGIVNLSKGPMVVEQPPMGLGTINDMWFRWIVDIGFPGPDRGEGGKYLLIPPGYSGPLPEGGYFVARSKTNRVLYFARSFLVNNDPKPTVENIKKNLKIYPYNPGGLGTSIATATEGNVRFAKSPPPVTETKFVEATGKSFNTIPPSDYGFFEMVNTNVQEEPPTSYDVELAGQLAAIGIVHGKPFAPDQRMKKILTDAAAVGNAAGRLLNWRYALPHPEWSYYPNSKWSNMLWQGGAFFETPPPQFEDGMFKPLPATGARTLDSRTAFFYAYTLDSPSMIMRIPDVGSQYLIAFADAAGMPFDGAKTYKVTLPKGIPAARFWSLTLYDNQSRSMLDTPQRFPRAGSQTYPSTAAEPSADGSTTVYFAPTQPPAVTRGNWIQTIPGKGWFTILRLYSPLESFFDKSWQVSEIEEVRDGVGGRALR
jgi:hypothetical protein